MGDKRLLETVTERLALGRRMRILKHKTARWFLPPIRQSSIEATPVPRLRVLSSAAHRRSHEPSLN
jgi:hypothetical protein